MVTLQYLDRDHYASTHYECDNGATRAKRDDEVEEMNENYVECPELSGKTIQTLRIYKDAGDGTEMHLDLTDGTSFSYSVCNTSTVKATLYKGGVGTPQVIHDYEV